MIGFLGLSHHTAPIAVREKLALAEDARRALLSSLVHGEHAAEAFLINTCNRVELYVSPRPGRSVDEATEAACSALATHVGPDALRHLTRRAGDDALLHLLRVTASLDSMVVGESQILGQVKEAVALAQEAGALGPELTKAIEHALVVARRVRSETTIGEGQVSIPSIAIDLARQIFSDLSGREALLVGSGEMAIQAAKLLHAAGANITVLGRNLERANAAAHALQGRATGWDALTTELIRADIIISSTAAEGAVITHSMVQTAVKSRKGRTLFVIDIAVPRDVEPTVNDIDGVFLYDIDDLSTVAAQSQSARADQAAAAQAIVQDGLLRFHAREKARGAAPAIALMRKAAQEALTIELNRSLSTRLKHLSEADRQALQSMLEAAASRLLHIPTVRLKDLAGTEEGESAANAITQLFSADVEANTSKAVEP